MTFNKLQSLLPNDEIHYNDNNKSEFILYENTIDDFYNTLEILNNNNIKYTIETDELNLDTILI
tara:strand:+ start:1545 stop:1736 length:192 start_codon:yes stop_codon:yes gene_type:complete